MNHPLQLRPGPIYQREELVRDEAYKRYIRLLPCVVCLSRRRVETAHCGPRGLGQLASDLKTIPLCHKHHRAAPDSYHKLGPVKFQEKHGLEIPALIAKFNEFYTTKLKGRAA